MEIITSIFQTLVILGSIGLVASAGIFFIYTVASFIVLKAFKKNITDALTQRFIFVSGIFFLFVFVLGAVGVIVTQLLSNIKH